MPRRWLLATTLLLCVGTASACINSVGTDRFGRKFQPDFHAGDHLAARLDPARTQKTLREGAANIIQRARERRDLMTLTDLGILLLLQGQTTEAITLFLSLERRYPGRHETAANLGTALELAGHDDVALRWIRIGIQRNAHEHYGTEWLHARILEAKLAIAKDPTWLQHHSIAGVAFEQTLLPKVPTALPIGNTGKPVTPWELDSAFNYQLFERTGLVPPRDPIVANLLMDWATLNLAGGPLESADALYELAVTYGAPRDALMRDRLAYIRRVVRQSNKREPDIDRCQICAPRSG